MITLWDTWADRWIFGALADIKIFRHSLWQSGILDLLGDGQIFGKLQRQSDIWKTLENSNILGKHWLPSTIRRLWLTRQTIGTLCRTVACLDTLADNQIFGMFFWLSDIWETLDNSYICNNYMTVRYWGHFDYLDRYLGRVGGPVRYARDFGWITYLSHLPDSQISRTLWVTSQIFRTLWVADRLINFPPNAADRRVYLIP